ncbi:flagellar basal body rod protein FlgB [Aminobacter sp. P9b]|uniref:Flagellar basal-body rod protein FlgB n=1 Tax=Aminobacter niigataensis TaxID=83265 RepID=A0ABR6L7Q4_9HYPH|nr:MULTISPECIES: flagellar basal body rod protein FlgB [Aminobacter]AWC22750.1 flagellar basal body rod protein FlgB [Aminobacter sp. MSH1]MBB4652841.1 flagellar basal-body rod protein FlgB [Aminobacter niigataensis]CAI2933375.1 Flagellar basal-body rod protein FlgB [Aminobacter niigataensis]
MEPVNLFDLAAQQARWLSVRQNAIAGNVANANTPGYRTNEIEPFERVLDRSRVAMTSTQAGHLTGGATEAGFAVKPEEPRHAVLPSDNTVAMEDELMKAGEVRRSFELNTAIVKAFHRMIMLSSKG